MDNHKKSKLSSIFGGLIRRKEEPKLPEPILQTDNVECSMISHMEELLMITDEAKSVIEPSIVEEKTEQAKILDTNNLLTGMIMDYPNNLIFDPPNDISEKLPDLSKNDEPITIVTDNSSNIIEIVQIKPQEQAKISLSTRGKSGLPVSYSFYKCPMIMEYCIGSSYNFDNDIVLNPGRYEIGSEYSGENIKLQMRFSEYTVGDNGVFYKTENLTNFITVEVTKKSKVSFFAVPQIIGNPYDVKSLNINFNLLL